MEENPVMSMAKTGNVIRKSVHTFLQHYHYFTSIAAFIALPFSLSVLIAQPLVSRSFPLLPVINNRLHSLFEAAGFPPSSTPFTLIITKLSQTICSTLITLPFVISFLLLAKASVINLLKKQRSSSFVILYSPLLSTHLCNSFIIFSVNASCFSLFFLAFNFLAGLQITSPKLVLFLLVIGAVFYSILLANAIVICNLALITSAMEERGIGWIMVFLKACTMIRGKTATALGLAVPINLGLAAVEALFQFRIANSWDFQLPSANTDGKFWCMVLEAVLIAYLYSMLLVLEVIMSCFFYHSCKKNGLSHCQSNEECYYYDNVEKLRRLGESV